MTGHKLPAGCGEAGCVSPEGDRRLVEAPVGRTGPTGAGRQWTVPLPYVTVPLSLNSRMHPQAKARIVKEIRDTVHIVVLGARIPRLARCRVELHYVPSDRRRRDRDNLVATYKPCSDGIVAAGVVKDDAPSYMDQIMPIIDPPDSGHRASRLYLVITELEECPHV